MEKWWLINFSWYFSVECIFLRSWDLSQAHEQMYVTCSDWLYGVAARCPVKTCVFSAPSIGALFPGRARTNWIKFFQIGSSELRRNGNVCKYIIPSRWKKMLSLQSIWNFLLGYKLVHSCIVRRQCYYLILDVVLLQNRLYCCKRNIGNFIRQLDMVQQ